MSNLCASPQEQALRKLFSADTHIPEGEPTGDLHEWRIVMNTERHCTLALDLDDEAVSMKNMEIDSREIDHGIPLRKVTLFMQLVLRQSLADGAVAMNLFHDAEDKCLRGLEYFAKVTDRSEIPEREFIPAPGCLAEPVLAEFRRRASIDETAGQGTLDYKYRQAECQAYVTSPSHAEVRVYFTAARPAMRTKGIARSA